MPPCAVCDRPHQTWVTLPQLGWLQEPLCLRCWRWVMLWLVGQPRAADDFVAPVVESPF